MTNKTTKRALLASIVSLVLCFSMLLGTTYAWFTDSAATANNVITAGNLDIEVTYTLDGVTWKNLDGATDLFQNGLWEPGHTEVVVLKIENKGTLALKYSADINVVDEKVGKTKDNKDIVLSKILTVSTCTQQAIDANGVANSTGSIFPGMAFNQPEGWIGYQTTNTFENGKNIKSEKQLMPKEADYIAVKVDMATTVGNEANHKGPGFEPSINFGINVLATQFTYEKDSFGDQYDKDAEYAIGVKTVDELAAAIENGTTAVSLSSDIDLNEQLEVNGELTIYGNGNTITAPANGTRVVNVTGNTEDVTVTLVGAKLDAADKERGISFYQNSGDLDVTIIDCEITAKYYGVNVASQNDKATLNIKDSTLTGYCAFQTHSPNTVATFDNCVLEGVNIWSNNQQYPTANNFATVVVNSLANNSTLTFNNCTIIATEQNPADQWQAKQAHIIDNSTGTTIVWNDCTFIKNGVEVNTPESIN